MGEPVSFSTQGPELIQHLLTSAVRHATPCGQGELVWHAWGAAGLPAHPPLVLLHGGSGSWTHWVRNILPLVASGRQVFVPDLPGFGDSAPPASGRDADALVAPLEDGLRQLLDTGAPQGHQACDLVGFSFGGMTAGLLAAAHPNRVRRLVVCGAPGLGIASRRTVPLAAWRHLADPAAVDAVHRQNLTALMFSNEASITPLALEVHRANVVRDRMPGRRLAYTDALLQALRQLRCPVAAIYGREDALYQGKLDSLRAALAAAPDFRGLALVDGAGHWVQFERPDAFDAALMAALSA
ncbi:MAG: alpha/beta hydrolase [Rhodoferax sp.]|nr:alpha/beta hydrolase [Rhodoferax sp.]